jgi:hypothetical protein
MEADPSMRDGINTDPATQEQPTATLPVVSGGRTTAGGTIDGERPRASPEHRNACGGCQADRDRVAGTGGASSLLEGRGKSCDKLPPNKRIGLVLKACSCRRAWCPDCCGKWGGRVIGKLRKAVSGFSDVLFLTLTFDQRRWASPEAAYRHVRDSRAVSLMMRELRRRGYVTGRYFAAWEIHPKQGQWFHLHLLIEASYVPHDVLSQAWGLGFAYVKRLPIKAAINYVAKYVAKPPACDLPDWLLDFRGHVPRYQTSRGLFPRDEKPDDPEPEPTPPPIREESAKSESRTLRESLADCKQPAIIVERWLVWDRDENGDVFGRDVERYFDEAHGFTYRQIVQRWGLREVDGKPMALLPAAVASKLTGRSCQPPPDMVDYW